MAQAEKHSSRFEREQTVLNILQNLRDLDGLKKLFWEELNYERENKPLSPRQWPDSVRKSLAEDPILFASGGEETAFHIVYCRLSSDTLSRNLERPVVNQLLREHPYCLFVFSDKNQSAWHFLNVKLDEKAEKRLLFRRITVRANDGLRTAAERLQMLDLELFGRDLFGLPALEIQQCHDSAFDVEKVTKDFYKEIANWYFWARDCPGLLFPKDVESDERRALFLIRLLTRLIFCWFLREKRNPQSGAGLIPDSLFDVRRINDLLKDASPEACTYYTAILQNLFFATLNTEMDRPGKEPERRFIEEGDGQRSDEHMVHQLWRHARQLRDLTALEKLLRNIPFLNGGLFECLDDRVQKGNSPYTVEVRIDGFATDPKKQPKLPNFLFYGAPQTADLSEAFGDSSRHCETVRPLLDILNRYNFTLTENTPFDQEVALDPELLGHVFENLLAAFNPETGTVARKATGSFYTPRVVVDWMVDQALTVYFQAVLFVAATDGRGPRPTTAATEDKMTEKLKRLIAWEDDGHDFKPAEVEKLIDAIDRMKVIDPACGSGAFPMGMLQKLVHVLKKLDPDNKSWRRRQEKKAKEIESSPAREEALKAIERAFARDNDDYGRKLYLIENCLYGVDIQPIAVQIAKLRFFISLVVDQTIDPKEENYGILPLPNLETKVVAANTLLGLHRGQLLLGSNAVKRLETELQKIRHDYFTARSYKRKKELRKEDKRLCAELAKALADSGECTPHDAKRLSGYNPYDTNTHAPFFDPGWMFGLASKDHDGVFDIVIGNPPYVRQEELKNQTVIGSNGKPQSLKVALQSQYECFTGTADLYVYFFERSLQLLHTGGALSFITSNKYFRAGYGERLRTYLAYATKPSVVLDFGDASVFTSIAYPAILVTQKTRSVDFGKLPKNLGRDGLPVRPQNGGTGCSALPASRVMTWKPGPDIREFPDIFERNAFALAQHDLKPDGWRMENPANLRLLDRLRKSGTPLKEYVKNRLYRGLVTGLNEAFVVDGPTHDQLIDEHSSSEQVLKPFLRGRDVKRWRCNDPNLWLLFIPWHFPLHKDTDIMGASSKAEREFSRRFPAVYTHLHQYKKELSSRNATETGVRYEWYALQRWGSEYWREFEEQTIMWGNLATQPQFALPSTRYYLSAPASFLISGSKSLLAILNSQITKHYISQNAAGRQGGFLEYKPMYVAQMPIPPTTPQQQSELEKIAEKILAAKKGDPSADMSALEREIDERVYRLYGLTKEEIKIVEGAS